MALETTGIDPQIASYLSDFVTEPLAVLRELREYIAERYKPIQISQVQGRLLEFLIRATRAKRILEIGTFVGYSTIWMTYAAGPDAFIDTIESEPNHSHVAALWLRRAGVHNQVTIHSGLAQEILVGMPNGYYDFVFVDADKSQYPSYLLESLRCVRIGGIVAADNTLYKGRVVETSSEAIQVQAIKAYNSTAFGHASLLSTLVPLGDGLTISLRQK